MKLEKCPYDSSPIAVEALDAASYLVSCDRCGAAWELRGTWLHRVRPPDPATVRALRDELFPTVKG